MSTIALNKKYRTVSGLAVLLYANYGDNADGFGVHGAVVQKDGTKTVMSWTQDGVADHDGNDNFDLVEVGKYDHLKIDDLVLATHSSGRTYKRYFAGVSCNGNPLCWDKGRTSETARKTNPKRRWAHVELIPVDGTA